MSDKHHRKEKHHHKSHHSDRSGSYGGYIIEAPRSWGCGRCNSNPCGCNTNPCNPCQPVCNPCQPVYNPCNPCQTTCATCPPNTPTGATGTWCVPTINPCSCGSIGCGGGCGNSWGNSNCRCGKYKKCKRCRSNRCRCCCPCTNQIQIAPSYCSRCGILQATLTKTVNPTSFGVTGTVVTYAYQITNTGNVPITQPITIQDNLLGTFCAPLTAIMPGTSFTVMKNYTTTAADAAGGTVTNTALAYIQVKRNLWIYTNYSQATFTFV